MKTMESKLLGNDKTKVLTGLIRFSYVNVLKPRVDDDGNEKYSTCILIPKEDEKTIANIEKAMENANLMGTQTGRFGGKKPKNCMEILHDGDDDAEEKGEYFAGHYYINASSKLPPGVVNKFKEPITDTTEFYSGCYGHASLNFFPYNYSGKIGVACGLNNLMKVKEGEMLGGRANADDDFKDFEYEVDADISDEDLGI